MQSGSRPTAERTTARAVAPLSVETLTQLSEVETIAPAWRALESAGQHAIFFQSCAWCCFVWRTRERIGGRDVFAPRVIVVRNGPQIVAIWPLAIGDGLAGRYAQDLTEPFGQYSDILVAPGIDPDAIGDVVFAELARWRVDALVLRKVREDAVLAPWLAARGIAVGTREAAPQVEIAGLGGHEAYRSSLNAKTRKNLRNYRNRLAREGSLRHDVLDGAAGAGAAMTRCFDGRTGWLEASGLSSTAFADPAFQAIVDGLARGADGAPPVVVMRLSLISGVPPEHEAREVDLSLHWGFEHAGRYYAYMASKNPAYDAFSPGRLHLEDVIAAQAARGAGTIDLLVPALAYKTSVATGTVGVSTFGVPFTLRGRLAIEGWHGRVRPAMKAALLRLPIGVRRAVIGGRDAIARLCA